MTAWTLPLALALMVPSPPPFPAAREAAEEEVERLSAWPELDTEARKQVDLEVERLRKARTNEMGESATAALIGVGAGAAPRLLKALEKERDEGASARLIEVLVAVTGPAHTRLLADSFADKSEAVRTFCLRRVGQLPDPGVRAAAEAAWTAASKRAPRTSAPELYAAALCATSAGSQVGLEQLFASARESWNENGVEMRRALEAVRGREAAGAVEQLLNKAGGERTQLVAGLHLLAGCGDPTSAKLARSFLEHEDHSVRLAAINALRGIVDGDPPLEKLPVFEAIEHANQWKKRL
jgi:hypothetical protein